MFPGVIRELNLGYGGKGKGELCFLSSLVYYGEGGPTGDCEIEMAQMWARCDDGAEDRAVVVPLLEPERDREGHQRG